MKKKWKSTASYSNVCCFVIWGLAYYLSMAWISRLGFYKIPVVVIFLVALLVACIQNRELKLNDKLEVMGIGISDPNIITMIIILCCQVFL